MVSIDDLYEVIPGLQRMHYWNPKIQDGGDPPSWKRQIAISQGKSSDFDDIWYMTANLDDQKDGKKLFFVHNSAIDGPISVEFCAGKQFITEFR